MKKWLWTVAATMAFLALPASTGLAQQVTTYSLISGKSKTETQAYVGLNWNVETGKTPAVVLGVFRTRVKANGDTTGGNLNLHINVAGGVRPGKLKLGYLNGKEDLQGEAAVGFNFLNNKPLLALGLNIPYASAGVDIYANPGVDPYFTVDTQGKFKKPKRRCVVDPGGKFTDPTCTTSSGSPPVTPPVTPPQGV